jgi:integrase
LEDAVDWTFLVRNPAAKAKPPRVQQREMKTWTPDQVKAFLEAEKDSREFPIWRLLITTGMRRGEALGLGWDSLDLEKGRLSIQQSLVMVSNVPTLQTDTKTESGRRLVKLDGITVSVLKKHQASQYEERLLAGSAWNNERNLVFVNQIGEMLKPVRITRIFNARVERVGLPRIRLHDLRHTHASNALQAGIHPKVVSERLGHANIAVTLNTYSHTIPEMDEQAAELVASLYR